ncbi:anthranilate synthase family protein [Saccharopolyspora rosea]|uniref:anthranilate synthase n=1 Tax=Saccharopolyspora rosea TaxID=524884 RepID=A0ABW3FW91_9PSEU|nr:anthranilate synthase family protein [Saccharopolyspora rosea]
MDTAQPAEVLARLAVADPPAFALLRRWDPEAGRPGPVEVLIGDVRTVERLADIPLGAGTGHQALAVVPFRQIRERGFDCHDDATPLRVLVVGESHRFDVEDVLAALPDAPVVLRDGAFDVDDAAYARIVDRVVGDEIAAGEGANFVIRRDFRASVANWSPVTALTLFRRLLAAERGAYWTFAVHTGERTLVGASPEVHVRLDGGEVVMNPISGTYRYPGSGPDVEGLLRFLDDPKEVDELAMVLDEELKMTAAVCADGGRVRGPFLREMAHLAHTEFEIRGRTAMDPRDVLRETMFAATVTGSPLENACRVIRRFEPSGRGYYAGALALFSRDRTGDRLDSPILIRAADVAPDGHVRVPVGATLVRDSDPASEVAETWAKVAGVLGALGVDRARPHRRGAAPLAADPRVGPALDRRRGSLAPFWTRPAEPAAERLGSALVIDTGDAFTAMLAHQLRAVGLDPAVRRFDDPALPALLGARPDVVVLGPGPGDPDGGDARMRRLRDLAARLVTGPDTAPVLGICLGHQLLARHLGLPAHRKARPHQGLQREVDVFGRDAAVGFYNSFAVRADDAHRRRLAARGVELCEDPGTGEVVALRGPGLAGVQFHPESVLTLDGPGILRDLLRKLVDASPRGLSAVDVHSGPVADPRSGWMSDR